MIAVEDLIADRMGQYHSGTAPEMLEQARTLSFIKVRILAIWNGVSGKKPKTNMELQTFNPRPKPFRSMRSGAMSRVGVGLRVLLICLAIPVSAEPKANMHC